ncbi:MAG: DEAD/DEAH box helicase, partial [Treponema sp.]|nr:DEAD/DEAH box helicase [Treponema sp.]
VIVDEAHSCAPGPGVRHLRFELLRKLAEDRSRHLLLVTATPHSGKDEAFGSLVGLLGPEIARAAAEGRDIRDLLGPRMVQRRRPDIRKYLETTTQFPRRLEKESKYLFSEAYSRLFRRVLEYIQGSMSEVEAGTRQHRIRWWSALALLRALSSSPQAVAATLRTRAAPADGQTAREADEIGKNLVLDQDALDGAEGMDAVSGSAEEDEGAAGGPDQRKLRDLAREAEALSPSEDAKLQVLVKEVKALLIEGYAPIVFCRFIETAEYVWRHLRDALEKDSAWKGRTETACVNGTLAPEDRQARIDQLDREFIGDRLPVLVATDCLSEGINLQGLFTAVIHYDLAWNPTRHEQREGRVDRFGQRAETVKCLTLYGANNPVDGIVLDVLIRKHKIIKDRTGVAIPVPMDSNDVLAAIMEGFNFRSAWTGHDAEQGEFDFGQDLLLKRNRLHDAWEDAANRDKETRTRFAQRAIDPAEVARELEELRASAGDREALRWFLHRSLERLGAVVTPSGTSILVNPRALPAWVKDQTGLREPARYEFGDEPAKGAVVPTRSHPMVAALAAHVLETALDPVGHGGGSAASRAGYVKTDAVRAMTTLLLVRYRYDISVGRGEARRTDLAEDVGAFAWRWGPAGPEYLPPGEAEALFSAEPTDNADPALARDKL